MSKMKYIGMTAYAKHKGVALSVVKRWIAEGLLDGAYKLGGNGRKLINVKAADRLISPAAENESDYKEPVREAPENNGGLNNLTKARTAKSAIEAQISKLKLEKLKGNLADKDEVIAVASDMARKVKDSLMNLPDRLAPELASVTEIEEINIILIREIDTALRNLSLEAYEFFNKPDLESGNE